MNIRKVIAECSFVEREEVVKKCIEIAKNYNTVVHLTVYRDSRIKKSVVMITKTSKERKTIRYIENVLST